MSKDGLPGKLAKVTAYRDRDARSWQLRFNLAILPVEDIGKDFSRQKSGEAASAASPGAVK